jgi:hypothetical protein
VVIPVFDLNGNITEMYGRKITPGLREGTPLHLYLPGPHQGVWNELAIEVSKEIILCEALIDALTFWCAGFRNVTASYGVGGFTDDHRAAFRKHGVRRVWIAYDRDEAGEKAALSLSEELLAMGIECFRVLFPRGCDANEYARTTQPAAKALGVLLNSAQWLGKGRPPERLTVDVMPSPAEEPLAEEPAAKEKIDEPVLSLAADPPSPAVDVPAEVKGEEIAITLGDRRYRVRGLAKNLSYAILRVNLMAARPTSDNAGFHVDTLDLYAARQRAAFIKQAAVEMAVKEDVVKHDLGHVLRKLEELQEQQIQKTLEPKKPEIVIGDEDRVAALELLKDPRLLDRILSDFERCGVVGEETNKQVGYIAAISRSLKAPLAVMLQSSSAAGKSSLMEAILAFVPEEQCIEYSAMTGQSLFYMAEKDLKHKVLAIVEEEGASRAAYALKLPAERRRAHHRVDRQGPGHRAPGHASVPRGRTGNDLPDHHGYRSRRRAAQPLSGADSERGSRTDAGHSPAAARGADARRTAGRAGARRDSESASQRATAAETALRGQSLGAQTHLSRQPDADPPRPHQIPDAHQLHHAASPVSAPRQNGPRPSRPTRFLH